MKLENRQPVEGTDPVIYIGRRTFKDRQTHQIVVCKTWHAEWNHDGKKYDESLRTTNKQAAIAAAHKIVGRIERGEARQVQRRVEWDEMRDAYINFLKAKGRASKTTQKYEYVTEQFMNFAKDVRNRSRPDAVTPGDFWPSSRRSSGRRQKPNCCWSTQSPRRKLKKPNRTRSRASPLSRWHCCWRTPTRTTRGRSSPSWPTWD